MGMKDTKTAGKAKAIQSELIPLSFEKGYEGFEGWGTSLAWWGHAIGNWKDREQIDRIMNMVFDRENGLGLNIVRYNIGGGENPKYDFMRPGGDVPGFQPEKGEWDWEADAGQRAILLGAIERGVTIAEAFSNSPPYWMTVSGSVTGAEDGGNNLQEEYYDEFADYLTEVVKQFRDRWGVTFRSLNPLNEPSSNWWKKGNIQEGAHFDIDKQAEIIRVTAASLRAKGLTDTIVSAPDDNSIDETIEALEAYGEETLRDIGQINVHSYNGSKMEELRAFAEKHGKRLWMSEYGTGGSMPHNHEDMTSVSELAERIMFDLRIMQPKAWIYWQAVEDESAKNNWGFIHANFEGAEGYEVTKQYYAMAQFSKFIAPGSAIAPTGDGRSLAAYNSNERKLTIVVRNSKSERTLAFDLSPFQFTEGTAGVYRTSQEENLAQLPDVPLYENGIEITAAEHSITTIIISDITFKEEG